MGRLTRSFYFAINILATVQFVWCYLWLTRPYVNTELYSMGRERMPFQGRCLMMPVMWWAHRSSALLWLARPFGLSRFWFPRDVRPEVLVQAAVGVLCVGLAGWFTVRIYEASSSRNLLTPFVYPLFLCVCAATYVMHTVQNFRFIYDLPSLAFFSGAMYLLYFRKHWSFFAALFLIATINRETTLLLLTLFVINEGFNGNRASGGTEASDSSEGFGGSHFRWSRTLQPRVIAICLVLIAAWIGWEVFVRQVFSQNVSEFYPRFNWNLKSLLAPLAWPQLLSACGYLLVFVCLMQRRIPDNRLRAWLWIVPTWLVFMFSFGILIETRVFGELISLVVCSTCLIAEEIIVAQLQSVRTTGRVTVMDRYSERRVHPATDLARDKSA